tara:strand:+ start:2008 stop:2199 length:192 start_codon:yes stop_codon:yes gene_type:complete
MFLLAAVTALFCGTNAEFFTTAQKQYEQGYDWNYVGKQSPSGVPAITIKPQSGGEYIIFKLKK